MAYTIKVPFTEGTAGLSLKAAIWDGTTIHATVRDLTTIAADGQGGYMLTTALIPDGYRGEVKFYTGTLGAASDWTGVVLKGGAGISPEETENTDVKTSTRGTSTLTAGAAMTLTGDYDAAKTSAQPGDEMDLVDAPNATALTAIGAKLEAMILDEGDATALLAAISAKIEEFLINEGDATATLASIATAVTNAIGTGSALTSLATQASVDALGAPLQAADYIAPDNAGIAALGISVGALGSPLQAVDYVAPDNATITSIATALGTVAVNVTTANVSLVKIQAATYDSVAAAGNILTLSNAATQTINLTTGARTTA